ncbi:MAG: hypothetical protein AB1413_04750 [Thermodesulfobacteriota bacterium]
MVLYSDCPGAAADGAALLPLDLWMQGSVRKEQRHGRFLLLFWLVGDFCAVKGGWPSVAVRHGFGILFCCPMTGFLENRGRELFCYLFDFQLFLRNFKFPPERILSLRLATLLALSPCAPFPAEGKICVQKEQKLDNGLLQ